MKKYSRTHDAGGSWGRVWRGYRGDEPGRAPAFLRVTNAYNGTFQTPEGALKGTPFP
jgi:hypothetical protein